MNNVKFSSLAVLVLLLLAIISLSSFSLKGLASEVLIDGRKLYQKNCAQCHDSTVSHSYAWKKSNSTGEIPPPPHNQRGHTWRHSDQQLKNMIVKGWRNLSIKRSV
ncbi:MAG: cytochrome c [Oceanospirillaceae bacterium]